MDFFKARMAGYTLTGILHGVGLYLVSKTKIPPCNQRPLIMNLALIELVGSWYSVFTDVVVLCREWNVYWEHIHVFFVFVLYTVIRLAVLNIIIDRLLDIFFNLKYPLYVTKNTIFWILTVEWIVIASAAVVFTLLVIFNICPLHDFYYFLVYFHLSLDILITLVAMVTYIYFYFRVRSIMSTHQEVATRNKKMAWRNFRVPLFMVISYILFNVTATVLKVVALQEFIEQSKEYTKHYILLAGLSAILDTLGWISDALIYVFLQKKIRDVVTSHMQKLIRSNREPASEITLNTMTRSVVSTVSLIPMPS